MRPYIEYYEHENNNSILHIVFLEAVENVSISNDCILLNYRDDDTATNIVRVVGYSMYYPILQDVVDDLNDWRQKLESDQTRKYRFSITDSITKHEKAYMQKLLNS